MQIKELPPMEVLQQCQYRRGKWIKYVSPDVSYVLGQSRNHLMTSHATDSHAER